MHDKVYLFNTNLFLSCFQTQKLGSEPATTPSDDDPWHFRSQASTQQKMSSESDYGDENIFKIILSDMLEQHKKKHEGMPGCKSCKIDPEEFNRWDETCR